MKTQSASKARQNLFRLMDEVSTEHEPILITGKRKNAVLVGEDDWNALQETLYLLNVPGMRESIVDGMKAPVEELSSELDW